MRDARVARRPANRVVELTAWDVLSLSFDGATAGRFKEGQRFRVSIEHINYLPFAEHWRPPRLDHESAADAEECLDGSSGGRLTCIRQLEQNFTVDQILGVRHALTLIVCSS